MTAANNPAPRAASADDIAETMQAIRDRHPAWRVRHITSVVVNDRFTAFRPGRQPVVSETPEALEAAMRQRDMDFQKALRWAANSAFGPLRR